MKLAYIEAGQIVTTHGVRGEVKMLPWTDGPEFMCDYRRVCIDGKEYRIEACRVQKSCNLLKLAGVDTVEAGQQLRGKTVKLYREDIPGELIFAAELIGVSVYHNDTMIGKITDVLDYPGNKVYVVKGAREYMIPAVKAFVLDLDMDNERMQVNLIEGMATDEN